MRGQTCQSQRLVYKELGYQVLNPVNVSRDLQASCEQILEMVGAARGTAHRIPDIPACPGALLGRMWMGIIIPMAACSNV